jgi:hypothetical protein
MWDLILLSPPVVIIIYFLIYPDQFAALLAWTMNFLR